MFWNSKPQRCKTGFHRKNNKCIRNTSKKPINSQQSPNSCSVDGKSFCKQGDKPLKPPIARAGGKSQIAKKIIDKSPPHKVYVEPFVGGGAVFLKKPLAEKNVINDKDKDVVTAFKSFKEGSGFSKCDMRGSKEKYDKIKNKSNKSACDVAYLNKWSFGSNINGKRYVLDGNQSKKLKQYGNRFRPKDKDFGIKYQKAHLEDYKKKLQNTKITNQDFNKVMQQNDSKETFHYLDPPYVGTEKIYKENDSVSPEKVCSVAKRMKGKVMISYNDHPLVRKSCKGMNFHKINTKYRLSSSSEKIGKEVLIKNY